MTDRVDDTAALRRTSRLHLVDARDDAKHWLGEYRAADDAGERLRNELAAATTILELELDVHAGEKVNPDPEVILNRDAWSAEQYAERIEELLRLFDDLGFDRLVKA